MLNLRKKSKNFTGTHPSNRYEKKSVRSAVSLRLEEKYARSPTEAEIEQELDRFEKIIASTNDYIYDKASIGFEAIMDKEKHNQKWEKEVNDYLENKMKEEAISIASIQDVDCTERICRMVFTHENPEDRDSFIDNYAPSIGIGSNGAQVFYERASDNNRNLETNIYITKKWDPLIFMDIREAIYNELELSKNQKGDE